MTQQATVLDTNEFCAEFGKTLIFQHLNFAETKEILAGSRIETVYEGEYLVHEGLSNKPARR